MYTRCFVYNRTHRCQIDKSRLWRRSRLQRRDQTRLASVEFASRFPASTMRLARKICHDAFLAFCTMFLESVVYLGIVSWKFGKIDWDWVRYTKKMFPCDFKNFAIIGHCCINNCVPIFYIRLLNVLLFLCYHILNASLLLFCRYDKSCIF